MRKSKHYYNYTDKTHNIENLPSPMKELWDKYKDKFVMYFECVCIYGIGKNGWTIGTYLPRKDNSKNFRFVLQFNFKPTGEFDELFIQCYKHKKLQDPNHWYWAVDKKCAYKQVDEEFFQFLIKHKDAPQKIMKIICNKLNKIIDCKNKLAEIETDF